MWLGDNANLSTGGTSRDVTDETHPDVVGLCQRVAAAVGLDVAGVDLRRPDIAAPLPAVAVGGECAGGVIEVNAAPGLRMHVHPASGRARSVAESIVDALCPPGDTGRRTCSPTAGWWRRPATGWTPLVAAGEVPGAFGGAARHHLANALAAVAAARSLDDPVPVVVGRIRSFRPWNGNPGRGMLLRSGDASVLADCAHSPAALAVAAEMLHRVCGRERCVAAVTLPRDRRDDLPRESARVLAAGYDRVVLYEDTDLRGRAPGEVPNLVRDEIARCRSVVRCTMVGRAEEAVPAALAVAAPGDVVLVTYEKVEPVLALLDQMGAVPVTERMQSVATGRSADVTQLVVT